MPPPRALRSLLAVALVAAATPIGSQAPTGPATEVEWAVPARLAPQSLLLDVAQRGKLIAAVGERGHILLSADGGGGWQQAKVPSRALLTAVWLHDERLGWAAGHDETILRTTDGGATWERVRFAPEAERPLLDLWFADAERGFAVGAYGAFLATTDGGASWQERPIGEDDYHLNALGAAPDGTLYLAAEAGQIYRSSDAGETWQALPSPYGGSFFGVLPLADGSVLVFGLRGHLYRSEDRGDSWTQIETGTLATLTAGRELGARKVVVVGLAGAVARSSDGGRTFVTSEQSDRKGNAALLARDSGADLLLFGEGGVRRVAPTP